jgi:glycosyltransferase involved in cell wall biosynthesis
MDNSLLSIIIAITKIDENLYKTINSILSQSCPGFSMTVIIKSNQDIDFSAISKPNSPWVTIKTVYENDSSISEAWNQALRFNKSKWVLFWGAGEVFPDCVTLLNIKRYLINSNDLLIAGNAIICDSDNNVITKIAPVKRSESMKIYRTIPFHHNATFHNSLIFSKLLFDTNLFFSADYELILKSKAYKYYEFLDIDIVIFTNDGLSSDTKNSLKIGLEFFKSQIKHLNCILIPIFLLQLFIQFCKYLMWIIFKEKAGFYIRKISRLLGFNSYSR